MCLKTVSGGNRLLFFYEPLRPSDLRVVRLQMGARKFDPSIVIGTASRCGFGCPRVVVCSPLSRLAPFPTSFWLTCPWLARLAGGLESSGGVSELERQLENLRDEWLFFDMDHRLARMALLPAGRLNHLRRFKPALFDRLRRDGIGGTRYDGFSPVRVKCVHLQTASWLAFRRHPGEEWLLANGLGEDCGGAINGQCLPRR